MLPADHGRLRSCLTEVSLKIDAHVAAQHSETNQARELIGWVAGEPTASAPTRVVETHVSCA